MTRILVVQTAFLGDVVLTTPLLRNLHRTSSGVRVTVATHPVGVRLLEGLPFVDALVPFDKGGSDRGLRGLFRSARKLRRLGFDAAVAAQRSHRTAALVRAAGIRTRVGFDSAPGAWAYNRKVPWSGDRHAVHRYLALGEPLGARVARADPEPELHVRPEARQAVLAQLRSEGVGEGDRVLGVAPGSVWATKRWTPEGYAAMLRGARERGLRAVMLGSAEERALCERVVSLARTPAPVLAGRTSIPELVALVARCSALVTNDSGPAHVATAVGTPVVAVFGPTHPRLGYAPASGPRRIVQNEGLECRPCHHHGPRRCPLGHFRCMLEIGPERVLAALDSVL